MISVEIMVAWWCCQRMLSAQISQKKLLQIATKPRNRESFSLESFPLYGMSQLIFFTQLYATKILHLLLAPMYTSTPWIQAPILAATCNFEKKHQCLISQFYSLYIISESLVKHTTWCRECSEGSCGLSPHGWKRRGTCFHFLGALSIWGIYEQSINHISLHSLDVIQCQQVCRMCFWPIPGLIRCPGWLRDGDCTKCSHVAGLIHTDTCSKINM